MKQISMPVKADSQVNIKTSDDLSLAGSDQMIMTAMVRHSDSLKFSESGGKVDIKATSDLRMQLPAQQPVTVEKVGGDAHVGGLSQRVIIGKVGGDLSLTSLTGASVEMVGGDLSLQHTAGAVEIARVGGDLIGDDVEAVFSRAVGGDIFLQSVSGSLNLVAGGDVNIALVSPDLAPVTIIAGGDVRIMVKAACNAQLELFSEGSSIRLNVCGQQGEWDQEDLSLPLGEGGNTVKVKAGGEVFITDHDGIEGDFKTRFDDAFENWQDFGVDLEKQIQESVAAATEGIQWASLGAARASEKAHLKVEKAMRKLEQKGVHIADHGIHVGRHGRDGKTVRIDDGGIHIGGSSKVVGFTYPGETGKTSKTGSNTSDEERIMVLRMLQDKKITLEEAEKLLSALEK